MSWRSLEELSKEFDLDTSTDREAMRESTGSASAHYIRTWW